MTSLAPYNPEHIVEMQTIKPEPMKKLFESLKEVLIDVNLIFDKDGMKILAMNNSQTLLVYFKIDKDNLEHYYVRDRFLAGVNVLTFFKQIKSGGSDDALFIYIDEHDNDRMHIQYRNKIKVSNAHYRLMNVEDDQFNNPEHEYTVELNIPAGQLQAIFKDLYNTTKYVEIRSIGNQLIFATASENECDDHVTKDITLQVTNKDEKEEDNFNIIQGVFDLEILVRFTKATNINPNGLVNILLDNDQPLILEYEISSLGRLRFMLAPRDKDTY